MTHPWIDRIKGCRVHFTDKSSAEYDAILFGTGWPARWAATMRSAAPVAT